MLSDEDDEHATAAELQAVGMLDYFDQELRPIFVLDIKHDNDSKRTLHYVHQNTFLRISTLWARLFPHAGLLDTAQDSDETASFRDWIRTPHNAQIESTRFTKYADIHWSKSQLLGRWRIISGTQCATPADSVDLANAPQLEGALKEAQQGLFRDIIDGGYRDMSKPNSDTNEYSTIGAVDLSVGTGAVKGNLNVDNVWRQFGYPEFADVSSEAWFNQFDLASTGLGSSDQWPPELKRLSRILETEPNPAILYWGPQRLTLYNEPYSWIAAKRHPAALGQPFAEVWPELKDTFGIIFDRVGEVGKSLTVEDTEVFVERNGMLEQTYFTWSCIPIYDEDRNLVSIYVPTRETTSSKILYRRMHLLLTLSEKLGKAVRVREFWQGIVDALEDGGTDVPFLLLYGSEEITEGQKEAESKEFTLHGTLGYPTDLHNLPDHLNLDRPESDFKVFAERCRDMQEPMLLSTTDGSFPARMLTTIHTRSFSEECTKAVCCPIRTSIAGSTRMVGFFVLGLNSRRPYDEEYRLFIHLLNSQMSSFMASALLFEDIIRRGQSDKSLLKSQLANQMKLTENSEIRYQSMADLAPIAMYKFHVNGTLEYANKECSRLMPGASTVEDFVNAVHPEFRNRAVEALQVLQSGHKPSYTELQLSTSWVSPEGDTDFVWVLAASTAELDNDGKLVGMHGLLTEISQQKWAERVQARRLEQELQLKRQQELFIDMTSHEMRNPLSAIIQCADSIIAGLGELHSSPESVKSSVIAIEGAMDAAQTIVYCAQHQKRISDDVLVFSKLNSRLVTVTPSKVSLAELLIKGLKVFEREFKKAGIEAKTEIQPSINIHNARSLLLDSDKLLQILFNLISSASRLNDISTSEGRRRRNRRCITVRSGASLTNRFDELQTTTFLDAELDSATVRSSSFAEGPDADPLYVYVAVQDSGLALDVAETQEMFRRFSDAVPKTHAQFEGSGLGLYISKRLAELHGGAMGISNDSDAGSTLVFYIRCCRSKSAPEEQEVQYSLSRAEKGPRPAPLDSRVLSLHSQRASDVFSSRSPLNEVTLASVDDPAHANMAAADDAKNGSLHVLVVEDNLVNQKVLQKQLVRLGHKVIVANNGVEALGHMKRTTLWSHTDEERTLDELHTPTESTSSSPNRRSVDRPLSSPMALSFAFLQTSEAEPIPLDVILMDIEMPVMDGLACIRRIRVLQDQGQICNHVPTIAVTANARREQVQDAMDAGMDDVVCKPFRIPELIRKIEAVLEKLSVRSND